MSLEREHLHFVTGRLAEHALREEVARLAESLAIDYTIDVLPITVAALMTAEWIDRRLAPPAAATRILLPGYCRGDLAPLAARLGLPVERGPHDLRQLPEFFGRPPRDDYGGYDIEIVAEINHAPDLPLAEIVAQARRLAADGADVIDVGCNPGPAWQGVDACVRALTAEGLRVSIDSLNVAEIEAAVAAGAELVLSVNSSNRAAARGWGVEVVAIPDEPTTLAGLDDTIACLAEAGVRLRIDPILEPIGCGLAASLRRYIDVRERYPDAEMLMGVGNLTELTDVDSAGVNVLLLGVCQELGVRSVLTTQVIPWARTSVRECDLARRLVHYAVRRRSPPKHLEPRLVALRDVRLYPQGAERLAELAASLKDHNFRLFAEEGRLHILSGGLHLSDANPFVLFERLLTEHAPDIDPAHAFYLGYELAKGVTALTLGKQYRQDESLDWGYLTVAEESHHDRKSAARRKG